MVKHVHAELMAQYAEDAMETDRPWERWEVEDSLAIGVWVTLSAAPVWKPSLKYRRKQQNVQQWLEDRVTLLEETLWAVRERLIYFHLSTHEIDAILGVKGDDNAES